MAYLLFNVLSLRAQCPVANDAFQAGEHLTYDVYFKYGILQNKAGVSTLTVKNERYKNEDAYKMTMLAHSTGLAKKIFYLSDTMYCYMTKNLEPLAYTKYAHEGDDYTREFITYTYQSGKTNIHAKLTRNERLRHDTVIPTNGCVYDMMTVVYYARTLDYSQMKKGDETSCRIITDKKIQNMKLRYEGVEKISANDNHSYKCIILTLIVDGKAFEDKKEAMKVYLTNDKNRIPIRIDSKLKVGSTRVVLNGRRGNVHPVVY